MSCLRGDIGRSAVALLAALLFLACDDDDNGPSVRIRTLGAELATGQIFEIRMSSLSDRPIFYNLCPHVYERRSSGSWISIPESRPDVCPADLKLLAPGETTPLIGASGAISGVTIDVTSQVPMVITPGTYRIVFEEIRFADDPLMPTDAPLPIAKRERTTNVFEVVPPTL